MENGRVSQMMKKTTYLFPNFPKQRDSILESEIMVFKNWFNLTQLFSGATVNSSIKIGEIIDSRTTAFLFPTPSLIRFSLFEFEKLVSTTTTPLSECVNLFYNLSSIHIKVFDPGGNFCDSSPSLLSILVSISSVSVSTFMFDSNGNRLCSLLRLLRSGDFAFAFDPGSTNSFRFSLFPSTEFVVAFHLFFVAMMLSPSVHPFKSSHFVFDPGGILVSSPCTVISYHVLKSRFGKAILVEDFRGKVQSHVSGYLHILESRFKAFLCIVTIADSTLQKHVWRISFLLFKQIITFAEVAFVECVFCFCYTSLKLLAAPRYRSVLKSCFF